MEGMELQSEKRKYMRENKVEVVLNGRSAFPHPTGLWRNPGRGWTGRLIDQTNREGQDWTPQALEQCAGLQK